MINTKQKAVGAALAMAVAGLAGGATNSGSDAESLANTLAANQTDMMHCYSVNTCNGHNACKWYGLERSLPSPSSSDFRRPGDAGQMNLFDAA